MQLMEPIARPARVESLVVAKDVAKVIGSAVTTSTLPCRRNSR